jgi:hypothetical protein
MLAVALEGLDNILACGASHFSASGENEFAVIVE